MIFTLKYFLQNKARILEPEKFCIFESEMKMKKVQLFANGMRLQSDSTLTQICAHLCHRIDPRVRAVLQVEKSEIELRKTRAQRRNGADLKEAAVELERAKMRQSEWERYIYR